MKKLNEILFINENANTDTYSISFLKPEFQGGETVDISGEDAKSILGFLLAQSHIL